MKNKASFSGFGLSESGSGLVTFVNLDDQNWIEVKTAIGNEMQYVLKSLQKFCLFVPLTPMLCQVAVLSCTWLLHSQIIQKFLTSAPLWPKWLHSAMAGPMRAGLRQKFRSLRGKWIRVCRNAISAMCANFNLNTAFILHLLFVRLENLPPDRAGPKNSVFAQKLHSLPQTWHLRYLCWSGPQISSPGQGLGRAAKILRAARAGPGRAKVNNPPDLSKKVWFQVLGFLWNIRWSRANPWKFSYLIS